ncbi:MAG TPA: hypothetical protein VN048_17935 [Verrucomicrobiae bacterium]|jgi:hypothetical protein|nr:hypothetical protein [Verrucomicrobiae bacterium]
MAKVKSHAKWNGLSKKQRETLAEWLFEEKMGYTKAWERAKKELGFTGSLSSLRRYYSRTEGERMMAGFEESARMMASVNNAPADAESLRNSGMKVAAQVFFRLVRERPDELKAWLPLARLLAQCEKNDSWRAVKDEENEIRKAALQFARVRFQYDAIDAGMKSLPKLIALKQARDRAEMTIYDDNKMINDLRRRLFGDGLHDMLPENEEEEANPEIIKRRCEEGQRRRQEQFAREHRERMREQAEQAKPAPNENTKHSEENSTEANEGNEDQVASGAGEEAVNAEQIQERNNPKQGEAENVFVDEPRKLSAEERQREYEELMRRARGHGR